MSIKDIVSKRFNAQYGILNLCSEAITDNDIEAVLEELAYLEILSLQLNSTTVSLTPQGLRLLIKNLHNLHILHITTNQIIDEDTIININAIPLLYKLQITQLNERDSICFNKMNGLMWDKLHTLTLGSVGLGSKAFKNLTKAKMPILQTVEITLITDSQMNHLSKVEWPLLKQLKLAVNRLTYHQGVPKIKKGNWKMLQFLNIKLSACFKDIQRDVLSVNPFLRRCQIVGDFKPREKNQLNRKKK